MSLRESWNVHHKFELDQKNLQLLQVHVRVEKPRQFHIEKHG